MRVSPAILVSAAALVSSVVANPLVNALLPRAMFERAVSASPSATGAGTASSSSSIQDILNLVTASCNSTCNVFVQDLSACATGASTAAIASCACSSQTLADIRTCSACISADTSLASSNRTAVVNDYNSFVGICVSEGLASVTGTVSVGQSTAPLARTIVSTREASSTSAPPRNATYTGAASTSTEPVAGLTAQSGLVSSTASGAGAAATTKATSGAGAGMRVSTLLVGAGVMGLGALVL